MKKYMIGMLIAAAAFITAAPQRVSAAEAPTQNAILLEKESDTSASVSLRLSNAGEKIASLQFSLHMEVGTEDAFTFSEEVKQGANIYDKRYKEETDVLNV